MEDFEMAACGTNCNAFTILQFIDTMRKATEDFDGPTNLSFNLPPLGFFRLKSNFSTNALTLNFPGFECFLSSYFLFKLSFQNVLFCFFQD